MHTAFIPIASYLHSTIFHFSPSLTEWFTGPSIVSNRSILVPLLSHCMSTHCLHELVSLTGEHFKNNNKNDQWNAPLVIWSDDGIRANEILERTNNEKDNFFFEVNYYYSLSPVKRRESIRGQLRPYSLKVLLSPNTFYICPGPFTSICAFFLSPYSYGENREIFNFFQLSSCLQMFPMWHGSRDEFSMAQEKSHSISIAFPPLSLYIVLPIFL